MWAMGVPHSVLVKEVADSVVLVSDAGLVISGAGGFQSALSFTSTRLLPGSGRGLGSGGDSQGVVGIGVHSVGRAVWAMDVLHSTLAEEVLIAATVVSGGGSGCGLGRCVSGSPGADLVKGEAVSEV